MSKQPLTQSIAKIGASTAAGGTLIGAATQVVPQLVSQIPHTLPLATSPSAVVVGTIAGAATWGYSAYRSVRNSNEQSGSGADNIVHHAGSQVQRTMRGFDNSFEASSQIRTRSLELNQNL